LGILCADEVRKLIVRSYPKASSIFFPDPFTLMSQQYNCSQSLPRWLGNIQLLFVFGSASMLQRRIRICAM
jgi:hypothetical protein